MAKILLVDDDETVLRAFGRRLTAAGHEVLLAAGGPAALGYVPQPDLDLIVSDVAMPGMDGLALMRELRAREVDVPVVFVTGRPDIGSATEAVQLGAMRYLTKPVDVDLLAEEIERARRLRSLSRLNHETLSTLDGDGAVGGRDRRALESAFARALGSLFLVYQPIVDWTRRSVFGFEALARTGHQAFANAVSLFHAAERLLRVHDIGRFLRASAATALASDDTLSTLFVNIHASDLSDEQLYSPSAPLTQVASRVILEVTERATLHDVSDVRGRIATLRRLGFRIALDDLGAGYAGLSSFAHLEPDIVKLDMSLVRGIDVEPVKRRLVRAIASACSELGVAVVAEGIETPAERDTLIDLGCVLLQGFLFARPAEQRGRPAF